jgi:hypothetical protein
MANKPDFNDLAKKLNIGGLVDNVKSIVMPGANTPNPEEGDAVGLKLAEMSLLVQEIAGVHAEQAKRMAKLNGLYNETFNILKAEREGLEETVNKAQADGEAEESGAEKDEASDKAKKDEE